MEISQQNEEFMRLYARHEWQLRRYVTSLVPVPADVDDILQETAVALMRKFDQYDRSLPFFNWASRFALYEVMQHRKRAKTRRRHFSEEVVEAIAMDYPQHQKLAEERRKALAECLQKLNERDRKLVRQRYGSEKTVDRLAREINQPVARLYRSLSRIREQLSRCVRKRLAWEGAQ